MDIATLGLATRYQDIEGANKALDRFSGAAGQAEKSARNMGTGATDAARKTVAANDNVAKSASKLGGVYRRVAAIITGVFASAMAAVSLRQFLQATIENDRAQAQLAAAIRSTGGAAQRSVSQLNAHAAALQRVTNFGDEATNAAQGVLLTFKQIRGDQFDSATEAVLDLATAMNMDLRSAALQVGKALNDPVLGMTALQRAGIQFTESQKAMVKQLVESGQMVKAQTIILKELETQFGGSAKAARETLGGALASLRNAWGDLFELGKSATEGLRLALEALIVAIQNPAFIAFVQTIGTGMVWAFAQVIKGVTLLVNSINVLVDNIDTIGVAAATAGSLMLVAFGPQILGAVGALTIAIGVGAVGAVNALTAAMMRNPFGAFLVAITAAITALFHFRDEVRQTIGVDVIGYVLRAGNTIINSFRAAFADVVFIWSNLPDIIGSAVIGAVNRVIRGANDMIRTATAGIDLLIAKINSIPGINIAPIGGGLGIPEMANPAADRLGAANAEHLKAIRGILASDLLGAEDVAKGVSDGTGDLERSLNDGFNRAQELGRQLADRLADTMSEVSGVRASVDGAAGRIVGAIGQQTNAFTSALGRLEAQAASANAANTSGPHGGSAGGTQAARFSVNVAARRQIDALANERNVIQAGMQFKQLSPQEERDAQLRLAQIDLETAKLNQHMGEVTAAFQDLRPSLLRMFAAGVDFHTIVGQINSELKYRLGATGGANFFSSSAIPNFAGMFADGGAIPRGQFGVVGEKGPEFVKGPAEVIPMQGARPQAPVTHNNDNSRGDVNISVNVPAPQSGGDSRQSEREAGRRIAEQAAYHLREMGFA